MNLEFDEDALMELKSYLTPKKAIKAVLGTLVSLGATAAVIAMFRNPIKASKGIIKLLMVMGVFMLGCKAGDIAEEHCKQTIDNLAETADDIKNELKSEGENTNNATDADGRDSKQQLKISGRSDESSESTDQTGETSASNIRRRWKRKKKGTE